ncbi:Protein of unknown function DUF1647 domain containing protein [Aphelenchoides bicaudatus]|nr:Protein of unknown function DUF1647 domain containing protein [Aphelenchoides bicaudatus]
MPFNYISINGNHSIKPSIWWILILIVLGEIVFFLNYVLPYTPCEVGSEKESISEKTDECLCNEENFCFPGFDENNQIKLGRPFSCRLYERLKDADLLDRDAKMAKNDFETLNATTWVPIFMTVVSSNHYKESRPMLGTIMNEYPSAKVIYFDAGLTDQQAEEIQKWGNVDYRKFNFSIYPAHVPNLKTYAFKLAQIEVFKTHKTFYYFDSSVRVKGKLNHLIGLQKKKLPPVVLSTQAVHSVYATAHPTTLEFFPIPKLILEAPELEANSIFISDSTFTRYVFKWLFLCLMTEDCIAPIGSKVHCDIGKYKSDTYRRYINCHRFDQAIFNILHLSHMFGQRGALKYNYLKANWTKVDKSLVENFDSARMEKIAYFARPINIERFPE